MDLDASLKGLQTFKARLERLLDGGLLDRLEAAANAGAGDELGKRIEEVAEHVAALEQRFDALSPQLAEILTGLQQQSVALTAVQKLADPSVVDLLDWLAGRREALDVVLSLGETADGTTNETASASGATETAPTPETEQAAT